MVYMLKSSTMCCIVLKKQHIFVSPNNCNLFKKVKQIKSNETGLRVSQKKKR